MDNNQQYPVATYGTLKVGQGNHHMIAIGVAQTRKGTLPGYELRATPGFPFVRALPEGQTGAVTVDVFDITPDRYPHVMRTLDMLEGYREDYESNHYVRQLLPIVFADGAMIMAWVYTGDNVGDHTSHYARQYGTTRAGDGYPLIEDGDWTPEKGRAAWKVKAAMPTVYDENADLYDEDEDDENLDNDERTTDARLAHDEHLETSGRRLALDLDDDL